MIRLTYLPFLIAHPNMLAQVWWPETIFIKKGVWLTERQMAHEVAHVWQLRKMGWLRYIATYLWLLLWKGYYEHPMELEANALADNADVEAEARALWLEQALTGGGE